MFILLPCDPVFHFKRRIQLGIQYLSCRLDLQCQLLEQRMFFTALFIYRIEPFFQSSDDSFRHIFTQGRMHLVFIKFHDIIFQGVIFVKMYLPDHEISRTSPASSKAHVDLIRRDRAVKFYNIIRIIIFIFLLDQTGVYDLLLIWIFLVPVSDPHNIHRGLLIRGCKSHIVHRIIVIQCYDHSLAKTWISDSIIPVRLDPVGAKIIIHQSQSTASRCI